MADDEDRRIIVVKVGTSSIMRDGSGNLALSTLASLVEMLCGLRDAGHRVILVSSGAVGVGCQRMGITVRPKGVARLQALAAVGQPHLMRHYDHLFATLGQPIAQVLLSAEALDSRQGYNNAAATFNELFALGVIPIVNENDSVNVSELRFGDNDSLSALVAMLVRADFLFLATDVDALYTSNPHKPPPEGAPPAEPIRVVDDVAARRDHAEITFRPLRGHSAAHTTYRSHGKRAACSQAALREVQAAREASAGSQWGTGGIATKLRAAQLAAAAGITTGIVHAGRPADVLRLLRGEREIGTVMLPSTRPVISRKRWLMALPVKGLLQLDAGATAAVRNGSSLFAAGLLLSSAGASVRGEFQERDAVALVNAQGAEFARGLVNYSREHTALIAGRKSFEIAQILGFNGPDEIMSRHNIALLDDARDADCLSDYASDYSSMYDGGVSRVHTDRTCEARLSANSGTSGAGTPARANSGDS